MRLADFDTFAYRVELLRKETKKDVAGVYFAKTKYQLGPIKAGEHTDIQIVVCAQDQVPDSFVLTFERYDAEREQRYRQGAGYFTIGAESQTSLKKTIVRADGTRKQLD